MNPIIVSTIAVVIAVLCIVLAFRFGKFFFKIMTGVFFLGVIFLIIFGAMIVNDVTNFRENVESQPSLFVLQKDGYILTSLTLKPVYKKTGADLYEEKLSSNSQDDEEGSGSLQLSEDLYSDMFTISSESALTNHRGYYNAENYDGLLGNNYKVFIFNASLFEKDPSETLDFGDVELTKEEALQVIYSDDSNAAMAGLLVQKEGMTAEEAQNTVAEELNNQARGNLFILLLSSVTSSDVRNVASLLPYLQDGSVIVYPETLMFQVVSGIPTGMSEPILQQADEGEGE